MACRKSQARRPRGFEPRGRVKSGEVSNLGYFLRLCRKFSSCQAFSLQRKAKWSTKRDHASFHLREPRFFEPEIVHAGIDDQQASLWFEHTGHFRESLLLDLVWHMVYHPDAQHDI